MEFALINFAFIVSIILFVLIIVMSILKLQIVGPSIMFALPVLLGYILYVIYFTDVWLVTDKTVILYLLGVISFLIGTRVMYWYKPIFQSKSSEIVLNAKVTPFIFWGVGFVMTLLAIVYFRHVGLTGDSLRTYYVTSDGHPFYVTYGKYFLIFGTVVLTYQGFLNGWTRGKAGLAILGFAFSVYYAFYTQARTDVMIAIIPLVVLFSVLKISRANFVSSIKYILLIGVLAVIVYEVFSFIQQARFGEQESSFFSNQNQMFGYLGKPITAFDKWFVVGGQNGVKNGWGIVQLIDKIAQSMGVNIPSPVLAPMGQFNVYSYLAAPYGSMGTFGVVVVPFVTGIASTIVYRKAVINKGMALIFYSVFADSLFMSFFSWQATNMVTIYAGLFIGLLWIETNLGKEAGV